MRVLRLFLAVLFAAALKIATQSDDGHAVNVVQRGWEEFNLKVVQSNDDGWAEINARELFCSLTDAGFDTILSAPAENQSGTGSSDKEPKQVGKKGCQFDSCPAGSPPVGNNATNPRLNYVNSYPVNAMKYAIQDLAPAIWGSPPDLAVTGPNVGPNTAISVFKSGTVGAAIEAAKSDIPAIAFSGASGSQTAWTAKPQNYTKIYTELATNFVKALTIRGKMQEILPRGVWLNVNFPAVTEKCNSTDSFKYVLTHILPRVANWDFNAIDEDADMCGAPHHRLPSERQVAERNDCYVSVSVGVAATKEDSWKGDQRFVMDRLSPILTCMKPKL